MSKVLQPTISQIEKDLMWKSSFLTQYINVPSARRLIRNSDWPNKDQTAKDHVRPIDLIREHISDDDIKIYELLRNHEYDKLYKYVVLFQYEKTNCADIEKRIKTNGVINSTKVDIISDNWKAPTLKEFEDDTFDLKFSFTQTIESEPYKYPIIFTFFKKHNVIALKYSAISEIQELEDIGFYKRLTDEASTWLKKHIHNSCETISLLPVFKEILLKYEETEDNKKKNKETISPYSFSSNDQSGGYTSMKKTDSHNLPIIAELQKLAETFKNANDKEKLLNFLSGFMKDSEYDRVGLTWTKAFLKGKPAGITVAAEKRNKNKIGKKINVTRMHFLYESHITRKRVNYVLESIIQHIND